MKIKQFLKSSKGITLGDLQTIVLTFVIIGIVAGIGVLINVQLGSSVGTSSTDASLAINNSTLGIGNLVARLPLIGTIAGFVVLLGFVLTLLVKRVQG